MKTLYVSDLDGTLLSSHQKTSPFTNQVMNRLVEEGMGFSYATARSFHTAKRATEGLNAPMPLIVYNGAFIVENGTGRLLHGNFFEKEQAQRILHALLSAGVQPIVYGIREGREKMTYIPAKLHKEGRAFLATRKGDVRDTPVAGEGELLYGDTFYFTCIEEAEKLAPLHEEMKESFRCVYARDIYSSAQWLEIMPKEASKANAIRQLKEKGGYEKVVVFGDGLNDMDMFRMADEAYAVENAAPELKEMATAIIPGNDADGVARFLLHRKEQGLL